jgi:protein TonB
MAYADAQSRKLNPTSLTAAIAINGAVLAALFTAAPVIEEYIPTTIEIFTPQPDPPPPEPVADPKPTPKSETSIPRPKPIVPVTLPDPGPVLEFSDDPILPLGNGSGAGDALVIEPPAKPAPVMTGAEIDPRYMRDFQPSYPPSKIRMEQEGRVTVRILVGANGRVLQLQPVGNPDADFLAATRKQALAKWRFRPATRDGVPIEAWREISVRFELNS